MCYDITLLSLFIVSSLWLIDSFHLKVATQVGGHGIRIFQCQSAILSTSSKISMQVDGEPCRLKPSRIQIRRRNQANMIVKKKVSFGRRDEFILCKYLLIKILCDIVFPAISFQYNFILIYPDLRPGSDNSYGIKNYFD